METKTQNSMDFKIVEFSGTKHARINYVEDQPIAIIEALSNYIPIEDFKKIFLETGKLVKQKGIKKLIFDKRNLTIFHQPSMEWYFIEWKEEMYNLGLKTHRKILPQDNVFRQSVKIGREKIKAENPNLNTDKMDIQYKETLEEAINS